MVLISAKSLFVCKSDKNQKGIILRFTIATAGISSMNTPYINQVFHLSSVAGLTAVTIATSLLCFTPVAQAHRCRTIAQDWDGLVDVRSAPRNNMFNLMGNVPNGTELDVIGERGDWLEVYIPNNRFGSNASTGWVAASQTRRICFRDSRSRPYRDHNSDDYDR